MGTNEKPEKIDLPAATQALLAREQPFSFVQNLPRNKPIDKAIILMHGMFHNGSAMLKAAREEIRFHEPTAGLFALNGPFPADPAEHLAAQKPRGGTGFRVWYALPKGRLYPRREIVAPMEVSVRHVHKMIAHIKRKYGLREDQIHILAFSQGCAPALQAIVERERQGRPLASAALLCGNAWDPDMFERTQNTAPREDGPPAPSDKTIPPTKQRWFDAGVNWILRKRAASVEAVAPPTASREPEDELDTSPMLPDGRGRTPLFYAYIEQDDTVPVALSWYTATFMRAHKMPVALHISPSYIAKIKVQKSRLVRTVTSERPSYLRFRAKLLGPGADGLPLPNPSDETVAQLPQGHEIIRRPASRIVLSRADDGFGNEKIIVQDIKLKLVIDSHWVNPSIRHALTLWHSHGLLDPASGVTPLHRTKLPIITQNEVEYGWALSPTRLDSEKPVPVPEWLRPTITFNSMRAELRHLFWELAARAALATSRPIHHWFFHEPDPNTRTFQQLSYRGKPAKPEPEDPARAGYLKAARAHFDGLERESEKQVLRQSPAQHIDNK
jgi:predicted esterase